MGTADDDEDDELDDSVLFVLDAAAVAAVGSGVLRFGGASSTAGVVPNPLALLFLADREEEKVTKKGGLLLNPFRCVGANATAPPAQTLNRIIVVSLIVVVLILIKGG